MSDERLQSKEEIFARGKLFELVHLPQENGAVFEVARRAPGVRLIIPNKEDGKILLTREFRRELNDWDWRLPGGKVFDSLEEFDTFRAAGQDILTAARDKVVNEAAEEAAVKVDAVTEFKKSTLGATVEWDLYIFEATNWSSLSEGQNLEAGEQIETDNWLSYDEVEKMIFEGKMQEERVALVLLQWIHQQRSGHEV